MQKVRYYITKINNNILHAEPGESRWQKIPTYLFNKLRNLSFRRISLAGAWHSIFTEKYVPQNDQSKLLNQHYGIEKYAVWRKLYQKRQRSYKKDESGSSICVIIHCNTQNKTLLEETIRSVQQLLKQPSETHLFWLGSLGEMPNAEGKEIQSHFAETDDELEQQKAGLLKNSKSTHAIELNSGDLLAKEALSVLDDYLKKFPQSDWFYTNYDHVDASGKSFAPVFKTQVTADRFFSGYEYLQANVFSIPLLLQAQASEGFYPKMAGLFSLAKQKIQGQELLFHIHEQNNPIDSAELNVAIEKELSEKQGIRAVKAKQGFGFSLKNKIVGTPRVSIIIPTKDKTEILKVAIESVLQKTTYPDYEIILIDNNSTTEEFKQAVSEWERTVPVFSCIRVNTPFNFSELINKGTGKANGSFLVLLNNDTEIISPDWIEGMLNHAMKPEVGAVGAKLLFHNNTVQHAGIVINKAGLVRHIHSGCGPEEIVYLNALNRTMNYSAVTAACLMVEKTKFEQAGGFDELFAVSYNDIDFCLRLQAKGLMNVYAPDVELYHYESISRGHPFASKKGYSQYVKETELFNQRWIQAGYQDPFLPESLDVKASNVSLVGL